MMDFAVEPNLDGILLASTRGVGDLKQVFPANHQNHNAQSRKPTRERSTPDKIPRKGQDD
jgi:hypothetical protein